VFHVCRPESPAFAFGYGSNGSWLDESSSMPLFDPKPQAQEPLRVSCLPAGNPAFAFGYGANSCCVVERALARLRLTRSRRRRSRC
jgi:hypothetical protein